MTSIRQIVRCITALAMLVMASCTPPPTEEEIQEEFDQAVEQANACESDEDCVLIYPGCPLGCWAAVNADYEDQIRALAQSLILDWQRGGQSCDYGCTEADVACTNNECEVVELAF